jgi:hypothetical protein
MRVELPPPWQAPNRTAWCDRCEHGPHSFGAASQPSSTFWRTAKPPIASCGHVASAVIPASPPSFTKPTSTAPTLIPLSTVHNSRPRRVAARTSLADNLQCRLGANLGLYHSRPLVDMGNKSPFHRTCAVPPLLRHQGERKGTEPGGIGSPLTPEASRPNPTHVHPIHPPAFESHRSDCRFDGAIAPRPSNGFSSQIRSPRRDDRGEQRQLRPPRPGKSRSAGPV